MLMKSHRATRLYEAWLAKQIHLVPIDLALKHKTMKRDAFLFFPIYILPMDVGVARSLS